MGSMLAYVASQIRTYRLRKRYPLAIIYPGAVISNSTKIERYSVVFSGVQLLDSVLHKFSYIQKNSNCTNVEIGPFCSIAANVAIGVVDHPLSFISTSPIFYDCTQPLPVFFVEKPIEKVVIPRTMIGADVWIGYGVIIKAGATIGVGAVIGAGSVVTGDIPPYAIYGGIPARLIRFRFESKVCDEMLKSMWWNFDDKELIALSSYFESPQKFLHHIRAIKDEIVQ